jgi:hypothetical protein
MPNSSKDNPGSGHYEPNTSQVFEKAPLFTLRKRTVDSEYYKHKVKSLSPPPCQYEINKSSVLGMPSPKIGTS